MPAHGQAFVNRLRSNVAREISDRSAPVPASTVESIIDDFAYDIGTRRIQPAIDEVIDDKTELALVGFDFASFAQELVRRKGFIKIPQYDRMGKKVVNEGQTRMGGAPWGPVIKLTSNEDLWKFGLTIEDQTILSEDESGAKTVGKPRSYTVWFNTVWHLREGLEFMRDKGMNSWLFETGKVAPEANVLAFDHFVPRQLRNVFYGGRFAVLKALIQRLEEESKYLRKEIKSLSASLPSAPAKKSYVREDEDGEESETVSVTLTAFNCQVIWPYINEYPAVSNLATAKERVKQHDRWLSSLRFAARTVEFAFDTMGGQFLNPHWIKGPWEGPTKMKDIPGGIVKGEGSQTEWGHRVIETVDDNDFLRSRDGRYRAPIRLCIRRFPKTVQVARYLTEE